MAINIASLVFIDSAGYHYADFPTFLAAVQSNFQGIYGQDIYLGPDSQDGQFAASLAQAFFDTAAAGAQTYASLSPVSAQGVGLSRVVKINGLSREVPTFSTVQLVIVGVAGTALNNAIAIDTLQQQWSIPNSTVIPFSGTITVTGTSIAPGAIAAIAGTITGIFTPTNGWQTVNNPNPATPGAPVESDAALRSRQAVSTSLPAQTVFEATMAGIRNVLGVNEAQGYENPTGTTDGNGVPAHSIAIVVVGGDENAIADAIQIYKTPGTDTYQTGPGGISLVVNDTRGMPVRINFMYANQKIIGAQVIIVPGLGWNSATIPLIQASVAAAINAYPIGTGATGALGSGILVTQLYNSAYLYGTPQFGTFTVSSLQLALCSTGTVTFTANPTNLDTLTVNGVVITFVSGSPTGNQVHIGATDLITAANLLTFLQASTNINIEASTYMLDTWNTGLILKVTAAIPGPTGNLITLAKSSTALTLSGSVLTGGAYSATNILLAFNEYPVCHPATDVVVVT